MDNEISLAVYTGYLAGEDQGIWEEIFEMYVDSINPDTAMDAFDFTVNLLVQRSSIKCKFFLEYSMEDGNLCYIKTYTIPEIPIGKVVSSYVIASYEAAIDIRY